MGWERGLFYIIQEPTLAEGSKKSFLHLCINVLSYVNVQTVHNDLRIYSVYWN